MTKLYIDFETFSEIDIKVQGSMQYAQHESTQIICLGYAFDNEPVQLWTPDTEFPERIRQHVKHKGIVYAHNIIFDQRIWIYVLARDFTLIPGLWLSQCIDTAALCSTYTLPASLKYAGRALNIKLEKLETGVRLINKCCKLDKKGNQPTIWDNRADFEELFLYCKRDVEAMREIVEALPRNTLLPIEQEVWKLTASMNSLGLPIDIEAVTAIHDYIKKYVKNKMKEVPKLTDGCVNTVNQIQKIKDWCFDQGLELDNVQADTIIKALEQDYVPENVKKLLILRQELGLTSTAKYKKILGLTTKKNVVHDNLMYHGTSTGRWAGRGFQMQNLPRASVNDPEETINDFKSGKMDIEDPVTKGKALIRSVIKAPPGQCLLVSDYSSIENRVLAWLADDEETLQKFREGQDQYKDMASTLYQVDYEDVTKAQRQMGKVMVLGCLAAGTLLLTDKGPVPIENLTLQHKLWDGDKWVSHMGTINKGKKPCIKVSNVYLTQDHKIFITDKQKETAQWLQRKNGLYVKQGICLAVGKLLNTFQETKLQILINKEMEEDTLLNASYVEQLSLYWWETLKKVCQLNAGLVEDLQIINLTWKPIVKLQDLIKKLSTALSIDGTPPKLDALKQQLLSIKIMGVEELLCVPNGQETLDLLFCMLWPYQDMTIPTSKWTELIIMETMNLEILDSVQNQKICSTHDVLESGDNNRFTILTQHGPLIVSNCGYMMGAERFIETCAGWGISMTLEESRHTIRIYRDKYHLIERMWHKLNQAMIQAILTGKKQTFGRLMLGTARVNGIRWLAMRLPSGKSIYYNNPSVKPKSIPGYEHLGKVPTVCHLGINPYSKKWSELKVSPGRATENAVQGTAREVMARGMLNVQNNLPEVRLILSVHDEAGGLVYNDLATQETMDKFNRELCDIKWADGLPLKAEGYIAKRYKKG